MKDTLLVIFAIFTLLVVGIVAVNLIDADHATLLSKKVIKDRDEQHVRTIVAQMVSNTKAVDDWADKLGRGKRVRVDEILPTELERHWIGAHPILFTGSIDDIMVYNTQTYEIMIQRGLSSSYSTMFTTNLALKLKCPKSTIDQLLVQHPELSDEYNAENGVAAIAKISRIKTLSVYSPAGERKEFKIGIGECVDLSYTGKVRF